MTHQDFYVNTLVNKGIRPSTQRIAVYKYLYDNKNHPTVDTVYDALSPSYPTLSKTTVYNTLHLFKENNLVQELKIEDDEIRYDADITPHLHFKCCSCGKIYDIFESSNESSEIFSKIQKLLPEGFSFNKIEANIWGTCTNCK